MKSVEDLSVGEVERSSYACYITEEREEDARSYHHELVKKLLEKLPESERTVVTLYYLGEMTVRDISKFLGVSVNTITSRLQRARKRLQQEEELLVQEMLGSVQLPDSLIENIARKVSDIEPSPPVGKPFLPWVSFGTATVLVMLMFLGMANQYLAQFQKPYSFEAQSEPTIEIIDAPVVLNVDAKPAIRNQAGRAAMTSSSSGAGVQISESALTSDASENSLRLAASRWTQATGPQGGLVFDIFATSKGTLYTFSPTGIYRLTSDTPAWTLLDNSIPIKNSQMPMTEHEGTLYIVSNREVFSSTDNGETWNAFCTRPEGDAVGFVITDAAQQANITMYLALQEKGVFRSTDTGEQWILLDNGLMDRTISTVAAIRGTVFAGTDRGLYRLNSGVWEQLSMNTSRAVQALAVSERDLYVGMGPDIFTSKQPESELGNSGRVVHVGNADSSRIFHSTDLGEAWTDITPTGKSRSIRAPTGVRVLATGETLLAWGFNRFHSKDSGQTWTDLGFDGDFLTLNSLSVVAVNENTFYSVGALGVHRTIDAGKSWHPFMDNMIGTGILDLIVLNNRLYAHIDGGVVQSTNGGESWETVRSDFSDETLESEKNSPPRGNFNLDSKLVVAGNILYVVTTTETSDLCIFYLSTDSEMLIPIQGMPAFEVDVPPKQIRSYEGNGKDDNLKGTHPEVGAFAVSSETFYAECKQRLFKWRPGDSEWKDTGLVDIGKRLDGMLDGGFKLAVSGETVYVGKRDGRLLQSLDGGESWKDITPTLPLYFKHFKALVFAGSTVCVATDSGVLVSKTGAHWRVITDEVVINRFAVDGLTVYGAGDSGVYRLDIHGNWEQVSPEIPGKVLSLVVNRDRLYVATERRGMFHIPLEEEAHNLSRK